MIGHSPEVKRPSPVLVRPRIVEGLVLLQLDEILAGAGHAAGELNFELGVEAVDARWPWCRSARCARRRELLDVAPR